MGLLVGETLAALRLKQQAERVADPELRGMLLAISEDETRHAELAFRIPTLVPRECGGTAVGALAETPHSA